MQRHITRADACVDATIQAVGDRIVLGTPLGIGKPNHLINAFYRRAQDDPELSLTILSALSLAPPTWDSDLERRLVAPLRARLYPNYTELDYVRDRKVGALPDNVRIIEFYFPAGALLDVADAQRDHANINYSHVARDALSRGLNVFAQLVSPGLEGFSLSSNPDLTLDLLPELLARRRAGRGVRILAQLSSRLPYMPGPAVVAPETFDMVLGESGHELEPFGVPTSPVEIADHFVGLHASSLVRDGGTIQLGIGRLGDALAHALILRHEQNADYRQLLGAARLEIGELEPFERGLYAASEMWCEGLMQLHRRGILSRRVYDELALQRAVDNSRGAVSWSLFEELREAGVTRERLIDLGVLRADAPPRLAEVEARDLGRGLRGGVVAHAGFFLGSRRMYQALRELDPAARGEIRMTAISFVNSLLEQSELKLAQRRHARFINAAMKVTLAGAVVSDALADGRHVSGVGGQHDFATMGQRLPDARFVVLLRATRDRHGSLESNLVLDHTHVTLPDHLRDIVVTEYGVADIRGRTTSEVAEALITIADTRCQPELLRAARASRRLRPGWTVPEHARANLPARLERELRPFRARGLMPRFPLGTELTKEEIGLIDALSVLRERPLSLEAAARALRVPPEARPYLERMGLDGLGSLRERVLRRAVVYALTRAGVI